MTDIITLTKEEVRKAREEVEGKFRNYAEGDCFLACDDTCEPFVHDHFCLLCKRLTEFASQGDPEGKGEEDE